MWPRGGANPVDQASKNDYFDSMYHSAAAVGINTSAQIESGIVGRPVFSVRVAEYAGTQEGTLHFHYLLNENGGLLHMAGSLDEHVRDADEGDRSHRRGRSTAAEFRRGVRAAGWTRSSCDADPGRRDRGPRADAEAGALSAPVLGCSSFERCSIPWAS